MTDDKVLSPKELIKLADEGIRLVTSEIAKDLGRDALMDTIALSSAASLLAIAKLLDCANYRSPILPGGHHDNR